MNHSMLFEYSEDAQFFEELLSDVGGLEAWIMLFDFRDPDIKRRKFGKVRNEVFEMLLLRDGPTCQLQCHEDCVNLPHEVDHLIPLKTNVLNKQLRSMRGSKGKKVTSVSYGSNDLANLVLACSKCNSFKKHRMPSKETLTRILRRRL